MDGTNEEVINISLYTLYGVQVLNTFILKYS